MLKAFFIAPSMQQASYWATEWGYNPNEWKYLSSDRPETIYGYDKPEMPAFTCGTRLPDANLWKQLQVRGFTVYNAEDLS